MKREKQTIHAVITDNSNTWPQERQIIVTGRRYCQTLRALADRGNRGVTAFEMSTWALRLGHYIFILRHTHGLLIETQAEAHDGGTHARYRLISDVRIVADNIAA